MARARVTQQEIIRAIRAAQHAGLEVGAVTVHPDGSVTITRASQGASSNSWEPATAWLSTSLPDALKTASAKRGEQSGVRERLGDFTPSGEVRRFTLEEYRQFSLLPIEEQQRQDADLDRRWRDQLPSKPLNKRERDSLKQMLPHGVGVAVDRNLIKGIGWHAAERLEARGFIEFRYQKKFPDRVDSYVLTESGMQAAQRLGDN